MKNEMISVIVPIFNTQDYLRQCVDSILSQSYQNIEVILLNDGSTDSSLEIMQSYSRIDSRIKVIDKENQGYGATCNRGLREATGTWISIIEPDDWIEQDMFLSMLSYAGSLNEQIDVIKTPYWRITMPDTPNEQKMHCSFHNRISSKGKAFTIAEETHLLIHHPSIWSALYRKAFLEDNNISFMEFPGAGWADNPFFAETLCQAKSIAYLDIPFYCYREETPEKAKAFATNNTLIPLSRWNNMMDVLDRIGVDDPAVIRTFYRRGFTYLNGILEFVDLEREDVLEAAIIMCDRMDADMVFSDKDISPASKKLFAQLRGIEMPRNAARGYSLTLLKEGIYFLKNTGIGYTLHMAKKQLNR